MCGMPFSYQSEDTDALPAFPVTPQSLWSKEEIEEAQYRELMARFSGSPYFNRDDLEDIDTSPEIPVVNPNK